MVTTININRGEQEVLGTLALSLATQADKDRSLSPTPAQLEELYP